MKLETDNFCPTRQNGLSDLSESTVLSTSSCVDEDVMSEFLARSWNDERTLGKCFCARPLNVGTHEQMIPVLVSTQLQIAGSGEFHVKSGLVTSGWM